MPLFMEEDKEMPMEEDKEAEAQSPRPSWVYQPQPWDDQELHRTFERHHMPIFIPPNSIEVRILDFDGRPMQRRIMDAEHDNDLFRLEDSQPIRFRFVRYVSTNCGILCAGHVKDPHLTIMVSTRAWKYFDQRVDDCNVYNLFLQPDSPEEALDILNFLQFHLFRFYQRTTEQQDPSVVQQYVRPLIMLDLPMQVHWRRQKKTWTENRILVMDQEAIILYTKEFKDAHEPRDRMFFWSEQLPTTINKVSLIISCQRILIQTLYLYVSIEYNEHTGPELEHALQEVQHVPRKAFEEPNLLLQWLSGNFDDRHGKVRTPPPEEEATQLDEDSIKKLDQLEKEFSKSLFSWETMDEEYSRKMWITIRPQLEQALLNEQLPKVDVSAWVTNAGQIDSLIEFVGKIETELFRDINYRKALALTVHLQEIFLKSEVERIRRIVMEPPVDLLHKIHARGYMHAGAVIAGSLMDDDFAHTLSDSDDEEDDEEPAAAAEQ